MYIDSGISDAFSPNGFLQNVALQIHNTLHVYEM